MSDGQSHGLREGRKLDAHLAKLEKLTEAMVEDLANDEEPDDGPYLSVRVALRTPGGMCVDLDYDAEDAAAGETTLELRGMSVRPGADGIGADDVARLKHVLAASRPVVDSYSFGRAVGVRDRDDPDA